MKPFPYCFLPTAILSIGFTNDKHKINQCLANQLLILNQHFSTPQHLNRKNTLYREYSLAHRIQVKNIMVGILVFLLANAFKTSSYSL